MSNIDPELRNFIFTADLEKRNASQLHIYGCVKVLLRNVRINGNLLFRDHVWIKESKIIKPLKIGDVLQFTGRIEKYLNPETLKYDKLGIVHIRNIKVLTNRKKFIRNDKPYISNVWVKELLKKKNDIFNDHFN